MNVTHTIRVNALDRIVGLCEALNESGQLRAAVSPRSDSIARIRDLWHSDTKVDLLIYWGCFGRSVAEAEEESLVAYVEGIRSLVSDFGPTHCEIHAVFTDTHARINCASERLIRSYEQSSRRLIERDSWSMITLSDLMNETPLKLDAGYTAFFERELNILERQAAKIHGDRLGKAKAREYLASNLTEAAILLKRFPSAIFLHAGVSELNFLLPSTPKFYIYTGLNRETKKPWFLPPSEGC